jgi:hypothetical protein
MLLEFFSSNLNYMIIGRCYIKWIRKLVHQGWVENGDEDFLFVKIKKPNQ